MTTLEADGLGSLAIESARDFSSNEHKGGKGRVMRMLPPLCGVLSK